MNQKEDAAYNKGYASGQESAEWSNCKTGMVIGVGIMIVLILFTCVIIFDGDYGDFVNTHDLGEMMCEEHGLNYSHREILRMEKGHSIPKIYCVNLTREKEQEEKLQIKDSYLVIKQYIGEG